MSTTAAVMVHLGHWRTIANGAPPHDAEKYEGDGMGEFECDPCG
nr:hypothetical protein [Streptomyces sp. TRM68367]